MVIIDYVRDNILNAKLLYKPFFCCSLISTSTTVSVGVAAGARGNFFLTLFKAISPSCEL